MRFVLFCTLLCLICNCSGSGSGEAAQLRKVAGDGQTGAAGMDLPQPLVVRVTARDGRGVPDVPVEWIVEGTTEQRFEARTDRRGYARAVWVLDPYLAAQRTTARAADLGEVVFSATATHLAQIERRNAPGIRPVAPDDESFFDALKREAGLDRLRTSEPVVFRGRVFATDGTPAGGTWIRITRAGSIDSVRADATGMFSYAIVEQPALLGASLDAVPASPGDMPARVVVQLDAPGETRFVLVPRRWTLQRGTYAGTTIEIDLRRAFAPPCGGCARFYRAAQDGAAAGDVSGAVWPWRDMPLTVAFDSAAMPSDADTTAFWSIAAGLDEVFGRPIVRRATSAPAVRVGVDVRQSNIGETATSTQSGDILAAEITFRGRGVISGPQGRYVTAHELLHALGFGHTCSWRSVLSDDVRCPAMHAEFPTAEDIAYIEMLEALRATERRVGASRSLEAALAALRATTAPQ